MFPSSAAFLFLSFNCCFFAALLDLSGATQVKGVWMGSTTIPCTYTPSQDFTQQVLTWSMERDLSTSTIFRRDGSGDHILLSRFRNRVSVPKSSPGDASLHITDLEIPDSGHYTCQVTWRSENYSLITKEVTTMVKVTKGKSSNKALLLYNLQNKRQFTSFCLPVSELGVEVPGWELPCAQFCAFRKE